jgi:hypothetical protein
MNTFLLCLFVGSLGAIAGFLLHAWCHRLPPHMVDHEYCDERYVNMHRRLSREITARDSEIQRLMQGLS